MPLSTTQGKVLGILKPMGGGDPIPLMKPEVLVGRRPSCDICLDFHNISGKHCQLRLINSVWRVRDLGSTNGTSINGLQLTSEHNVMPDDQLSLATHLFTIDYEPGGPDSVLHKHGLVEPEREEQPLRLSLMEMAGLEGDEDSPRGRARPRPSASSSSRPGERPSATEPGFDDVIPEEFQAGAAPMADADDDDFLKLIEEDVKKAVDKQEGGGP